MKGLARSSSINSFSLTPPTTSAIIWVRPRSVGSTTGARTRGCRGGELFGRGGDLLLGEEQKPVPGEEWRASDQGDAGEQCGVFRKFVCEGGAGKRCEFRRGCIDHDQYGPAASRHRLLKADFALSPRKIGRDQRVHIGIDGKVSRRIPPRCDGQTAAQPRSVPHACRVQKSIVAMIVDFTMSSDFLIGSCYLNYRGFGWGSSGSKASAAGG